MASKTDLSSAFAGMDRFVKQYKFATAKALTRTGAKVKTAVPAALDRTLDRPTPFTKSGVYLKAARSDDPVATVGFKPVQAAYLQYQHDGGTRAPTKKALRLPSAVGLDAYGNIPRGIISKLLAVARKESKLAKRSSKRIRVSSKLEIFYGDPKDVGGHKFPPGIYKIVQAGGKSQLIPLIVFPTKSARYRKRFDMVEIAQPIIIRELPGEQRVALAEALATAR